MSLNRQRPRDRCKRYAQGTPAGARPLGLFLGWYEIVQLEWNAGPGRQFTRSGALMR